MHSGDFFSTGENSCHAAERQPLGDNGISKFVGSSWWWWWWLWVETTICCYFCLMFSAWADSSAHMASTLWDLVLHVQSTVYLWTQTSPCVRSPLPLIAHNWFSININRRQTLGHASPANLHLSLPRCSRIVGTDCEAGILVFGKLPKWNGNGIGNDVPLTDHYETCRVAVVRSHDLPHAKFIYTWKRNTVWLLCGENVHTSH